MIWCLYTSETHEQCGFADELHFSKYEIDESTYRGRVLVHEDV